MKTTEILQAVKETKKGVFTKLVKTKDLGHGVSKRTNMTMRLGVDYSHMKTSKGKKVGDLPWGQWLKGYEGLVIVNKGDYYLRIASSYANNTKSVYLLNGKEITKEQAQEIVGSLSSGARDVYNIKFENIVSIGTSK